MIFGIVLILAGLLAAAPLIVRHKPEMSSFLDKLGAWQGFFGGVLLVAGTLDLVLTVLPALFVGTAIGAIIKIVGTTVSLGLGLSLGSQNLKRLPLPQLQTTEMVTRLDALTVKAQRLNIPLGGLALGYGLMKILGI